MGPGGDNAGGRGRDLLLFLINWLLAVNGFFYYNILNIAPAPTIYG